MSLDQTYEDLYVLGVLPKSEGALVYKGTWDASTNTPTLASGVGTTGDFYVVSVGGSTNLDGITSWSPSDQAVFGTSTWQKISNTDVGSLQKVNNLSDLNFIPTAVANLGFGGAPLILVNHGSDYSLSNPAPTFVSASFQATISPFPVLVLPIANELQSISVNGIGGILVYNSSSTVAFHVVTADSVVTLQIVQPKEAYLFKYTNNTTVNGDPIVFPITFSVNNKSGELVLSAPDIGGIGGTTSNSKIAFGAVSANTITNDNKLSWNTGTSTLNVDGNISLINGSFSGQTGSFNNVYISNLGDDVNGNGSLTAPYKTLSNAMSNLAGSTDESNQFNIILEAGVYNEVGDLHVLPYAPITGENATLNVTGAIRLHSDWSTASGNIDFGINLRELNATGGINFDFTSFVTPQSVRLIFNNFCYNTLPSIDITGYLANNTIDIVIDSIYGSEIDSELILNISGFKLFNLKNSSPKEINVSNINVTDPASVSMSSVIYNNGIITISDNLSIGILATLVATSSYTIYVNGVNALLIIDPSSYTIDPILAGGATVFLTGQSSSINANNSPSNYVPTNPTVTGHLQGIDNELGTIVSGFSLTNTQVAFGSPTNTITSSSGLTYISGSQQLNVGGKIGIGTTSVHGSSIFDASSTTQGTRPSTLMTHAQMLAIASPGPNLQVFDTTNNQAMMFNGTEWVILG